MNRGAMVGGVCLTLVFLSGARAQTDAPPPHRVEIQSVDVQGPPYRITVRGTTDLAEGCPLLADLVLGDQSGLRAEGRISGGGFEVRLGPIQKEVVAATYTVRLQATTAEGVDYSDRRDVTLGDGQGARRYRDALRRLLVATRDLAVDAAGRVDFYRNLLAGLRGSPSQAGLSPQVSGTLRQAWDQYCAGYWPGSLQGLRMDLSEYSERIFLAPVPRAADELTGSLADLEAWMTAARNVLAGELAGGPGANDLDMSRRQAAAWTRMGRVAEALEVSDPGPPALHLAGLEAGKTELGVYTSKALPFRVTVPEGWQTSSFSPDPTVRLRMRPMAGPQDAEVRVRARWWGELAAQEFMPRLMVLTQESWPAFRLRVPPDSAATHSNRVSMEFESTFAAHGPVWHVLATWEYDPATGLAFGVECMSATESYPSVREAFQEIARGLEVAR